MFDKQMPELLENRVQGHRNCFIRPVRSLTTLQGFKATVGEDGCIPCLKMFVINIRATDLFDFWL